MCLGGGGSRPAPAPQPVRNMSPAGDNLVPELLTADEMDEDGRLKQTKKSGTKMLQTSGAQTNTDATSSGLNIA